ncbi:MAG: hypothetical protein F6K04_12580 [Leptolyngbya sp. SIO4C5]|nr:hypothetical protein [Leptolyngbya sp. SIO4C5]
MRSGVPFQAPPLPQFFVQRPEQQQQLKEKLLVEQNTLVVSALYGLGGIGKSVLASALAHDDEVKARFAEGVLWATLGQKPDILPLLSGWIQALGDFDYKPTTTEAASLHLRTLLYDKQVLLVVDDVWNPDHAEPFRVGEAGCCVLITTREAKVPGATRYELGVMSPKQAIALLEGAVPKPLSAQQKERAADIASAVGYLPLALELVAAQIEEGVSWEELLEELCGEIARIESLDRYTSREEPDEAKRRHHSLTACFNLSLKRLTPEQLGQFAWLGVLPEDVSVSAQMVAMLWQLNAKQAGAVLRTLRSKALLLEGSDTSEGKRTYRMHDLMHDLSIKLLGAPKNSKNPEDLPGLGLTLAQAHQQLLQRYRAQTKDGQWHTLPDDGYIHAHLAWHFEQAEQPELLHQLLQETTPEGRNGWYEACDKLGQTANFVTDVARAWQLADGLHEQRPKQSIVLQWRYALITTTLNSLAKNIPPELIAAFVQKQFWTPAQGLAYVRQAKEPSQRADGIAAISPFLPNSLRKEAVSLAREIQHEYYRARALSALAPHGPAALFDEALEAARNIQDEYYRARALSALAPHGPAALFDEALEAARNIQDEYYRASALSALAPHGPAALFDEALEAARNIQHESSRALALSDLAPHGPAALFDEALEAARNIQDEFSRARALSALAAHLPAALFDEALEAARNIQDESSRARALSALAAHLPAALFDEALEAARNIQDESSRALALSDLAPHLPAALFDEALEAARNIQDEFSRALALSDLAPHLPAALFDEALEAARNIQDEYSRARALSALAPHLPAALFDEALEATRNIQDESSRARALSALAPHLPAALFDEALEAARNIQDEYSRARALSALAPHGPAALFDEALEATRNIQDEYSRARALSALAPHLPAALFDEALEAARNIQDEYSRALALSALAPHGPAALFDEALEAARNIQHEYYRASALSALAPHGPAALFDEALEAARNIQDEYSRALALSALAPHGPAALFDEALEAARNIQDEYSRASALSALAPHGPAALFDEALEAARNIQDESYRALALSALAPHGPAALFDEALEAARNIQDEYYRASALQGFLATFEWQDTDISTWQKMLHALAALDRGTFIQKLPKLRSGIVCFSKEDTVMYVAQAMKEICAQWP